MRAIILAVSFLLLPVGASYAADPAPLEPARSVTIVVTPQELNTIARALVKMPYEEAKPVIDDLGAQIAKQTAPPPKPPSVLDQKMPAPQGAP